MKNPRKTAHSPGRGDLFVVIEIKFDIVKSSVGAACTMPNPNELEKYFLTGDAEISLS
ncbi:hypothetical protein BROSI_A2936 [Candidatus Brocadia sinica JPN1]|uniref:Uncharacterized protein n=1 Tax=Candidatus Brocadia sinica JPN1 TaxID=1197129 RepID=A0ABQ0K012_9BACT|nr:hypothetical protein BROSI_A2936 [Candidatus Brocadia sinica JPN1]